jgi:hypothetical protein
MVNGTRTKYYDFSTGEKPGGKEIFMKGYSQITPNE